LFSSLLLFIETPLLLRFPVSNWRTPTYLNGGNWRIVTEFTEIESGKRSDRPALDKALAAASRRRAGRSNIERMLCCSQRVAPDQGREIACQFACWGQVGLHAQSAPVPNFRRGQFALATRGGLISLRSASA
jgi:hypothetical protein